MGPGGPAGDTASGGPPGLETPRLQCGPGAKPGRLPPSPGLAVRGPDGLFSIGPWGRVVSGMSWGAPGAGIDARSLARQCFRAGPGCRQDRQRQTACGRGRFCQDSAPGEAGRPPRSIRLPAVWRRSATGAFRGALRFRFRQPDRAGRLRAPGWGLETSGSATPLRTARFGLSWISWRPATPGPPGPHGGEAPPGHLVWLRGLVFDGEAPGPLGLDAPAQGLPWLRASRSGAARITCGERIHRVLAGL